MQIISFLDRNKYLLCLILSLLLFWRIFSQNVILIFILGVVYYMIVKEQRLQKSMQEGFDKYGIEFVDLGYPRYDLKGQLLDTRPIFDCRFDCYKNCYNSHKA